MKSSIFRTKSQYLTIQKIIEYIVENKLKHSSLDELASKLKLSAGHLQKVFTEWVGISPKQFGRYLSLEYSKELLLKNKSMTETVAKSGLSSEGRLYDLFIDIEAMTPGEYKEKGASLTIYYSMFESRFGSCLVASTDRGICNILFFDTKASVLADLRSRWQKSKLVNKSLPEHKEIEKYFNKINIENEGKSKSHLGKKSKAIPKIKLHLCGTNFQIKVWEALLSIPDGSLSTYGQIASKIGMPKLSRVVGAAVGDNPIGYIIPCHRVLKSTGEISGYRWGIHRKRAMLGYEALRKNKE